MIPAVRGASYRFGRRGVIAGSALGFTALGIAALAARWSLHPSGISIVDEALAGPLGDVWLGSEQAKVTLVEYAALTCPHCAAFHETTWPTIKARWIDTGHVRFALRGYPLSPLDTAGFMLARADGDRYYYAVTDLLFEKQAAWAFVPKPLEAVRALMLQTGMGRERIDVILGDQVLYDGVRRVHAQATSVLGIHSTPTLFVNDARHEGALNANALGEVIGQVLERRSG